MRRFIFPEKTSRISTPCRGSACGNGRFLDARPSLFRRFRSLRPHQNEVFMQNERINASFFVYLIGLCGQKSDFLIKTLIFGVHFGVHILISFSLYHLSSIDFAQYKKLVRLSLLGRIFLFLRTPQHRCRTPIISFIFCLKLVHGMPISRFMAQYKHSK